MRFHIQPEEPAECKCGNTIASDLDWCDECDDEAREDALNYEEDRARPESEEYAYTANYDGEGW